MNEIQSTILNLLPPKRKTTPSGWTSVNAVCCQHNGHAPDKRSRGGIMITPQGGFTWHCFNCNFKAGWEPGKLLSSNTKKLFKWFGLSESDVGKLSLIALKIKDDQPVKIGKLLNLELKKIDLPEMTLTIDEWIKQDLDETTSQDLAQVIEYLDNRGMSLDWYPWSWSANPGFKDRLLIPFYHNQEIVGYTGRKIREGKPKYLTESQPGYVFNLDAQSQDRQFVIVTEGQFDAIAVDGVAIMTNEPSETQIHRINNLGKEVICVPDRDRAGAKMLTAAISQNWSVSSPPWEQDIKDIADAVKRYGRLYTLVTIMHYKIRGEIKIQLLKKKLEGLNG